MLLGATKFGKLVILQVMNPSETIEKSVRARRRGVPFTATEFKKFAPPATARRVLHRLAATGKIKVVAEDVFVKPRKHEVLGEVTPTMPKLVEALTIKQGHAVQISGAEAANRLGLSSQVPVKPIYLTTGPTRRLKVGQLELEFRHKKALPAAGRPAGDVIQALRYLGPRAVEASHVERLSRTLAPETKAALRKLARRLPAWMRKIIDQF